MRKNKLGRQKKFLMLASVLSIVLLLSTSIAGAAALSLAADSTSSGSVESNDSSSTLTADEPATPSTDSSSDDSITSGPSVSSDENEAAPLIPPNRAPVAIFDYAPDDPKEKENIVFDASDSYDLDGNIVSYYWWWCYPNETGYWRDIAWGNVPVIEYSFDIAGIYIVILCVVDNGGQMGYTEQTIVIAEVTSSDTGIAADTTGIESQQLPSISTVIPSQKLLNIMNLETSDENEVVPLTPPNRKPVAIFDYTPANPKEKETIVFDASDSYDSDGFIESYYWWWRYPNETGYWRDIAWGNVPVIEYSFDIAGIYIVILCVVDNGGQMGYTEQTIVIAEVTSSDTGIAADTTGIESQQLPSISTVIPSQKLLNIMNLGL